ncbi:MAG: (2Fe-2S)-binding protein [Rhodospirillaceae bacterium TMED167]|nr:(2Fe-2S)-binding protein [Rhodospirillaceae bacterium]OUW30096.1 MAG: (2Fe-2S)-binding protein [Rhodospirillaceae bacterium TMED167]
MDTALLISMSVNSEAVTRSVEPRQSLADFIRNELELTGTHVGCEHGVCGACTVRLDGQIVRGCLTLAVQADGCSVETIEGLTQSGEIADLQDAFVTRNAAQCGFCTPGMLLTAAELLASDLGASREEIRKHISGNYCRCTGYQAVVDAIESTAQSRMGEAP